MTFPALGGVLTLGLTLAAASAHADAIDPSATGSQTGTAFQTTFIGATVIGEIYGQPSAGNVAVMDPVSGTPDVLNNWVATGGSTVATFSVASNVITLGAFVWVGSTDDTTSSSGSTDTTGDSDTSVPELSALPEPMTLSLLGAGLIGVVAVRGRRAGRVGTRESETTIEA